MSNTYHDLLNELIRDATRTNNAERDLRSILNRVTTFTVEMHNPVELPGDTPRDAFDRITEREAATRLGRLIMSHERAVTRREFPDQQTRRYVVRVILEEQP